MLQFKRISFGERILSVATRIRPGEGKVTYLLILNAYLILFSHYLLKVIRETLILSNGSALDKSIANAITALTIALVVSVYGFFYCKFKRRKSKDLLTLLVNGFFVSNILIFMLAIGLGIDSPTVFYVWQGIYGVLVVSHFWSFCADIMNQKTGQRLFPPIMVGASLGAWSGSYLAEMIYSISGVFSVMLTALSCLALATVTSSYACRILPNGSKNHSIDLEDSRQKFSALEGFKLVFKKKYLLYTALFVLLMNWINSTGEFILASYIKDEAIRIVSLDPSKNQDSLISAYYSSFYTWVSVIGFVLQTFIVSRLLHWIGLKGSMYILPLVMIIGYGLLAFLPLFVIARMTMIVENSCSYSIANTAKNILYLPLNREEKYVGKTTIDTFFWRLGDLLQFLVIAGGINYFAWGTAHFIWLNLFLSSVMFYIVFLLMKNYRVATSGQVIGTAPFANKNLPVLHMQPGIAVRKHIPEDLFLDDDPGDAFRYFLTAPDQLSLPNWIRFDPHHLTLDMTPPRESEGELSLTLKVTDADELSCEVDLHLKWFKNAIISQELIIIASK